MRCAHRWLQLAGALALGGCTLLFPTSNYTEGASDGALSDGGPRDAAPTDGALFDGEIIDDAGPRPDTGPRPDAGPIDEGWPVCGNSAAESPLAVDAAGGLVVPTSALLDALFGSSGTPEIGLVSDTAFPAPSIPSVFADVGVARGEASGTFVVGAITQGGELSLRQLSVSGDPAAISFGPAFAVTWRDARSPTSLSRMAMRRVDGVLRIGLVGSDGAGGVAWDCVARRLTVACGVVEPFPSATQIQSAAITDTGADTSEILFAGRQSTAGYATRASAPEASPSARGLAPGPRLSGTDGRLVLAHDSAGQPFAYRVPDIGVASEFALGASPALVGLAAAAGRFLMVRATPDSAGYTLAARPLVCEAVATDCGCPTSAVARCGTDDGYATPASGVGRVIFVDAEPAGGAVLAVVGVESGPDTTDGTEVRLLAFDATTGNSVLASTEGPEILLGSGVASAPFVGRLIPGVGMRFATEVQPTTGTMDLVQAAMVTVDGGPAQIFVSALRICRAP